MSKGNRALDSSVIGNLGLERLGVLDKVAYIRFASVYRHFENLDEFMREIYKVGGEPKT
jgi:transcriptional repressor NrdR